MTCLPSSPTTMMATSLPRSSCLRHSKQLINKDQQDQPKRRRAVHFDAAQDVTCIIPRDQRPTAAEKASLWYSSHDIQDFRSLAKSIRSNDKSIAIVLDEVVESRRGLENTAYNYHRGQAYLDYVLKLQEQHKADNEAVVSSSSTSSGNTSCLWTNDPVVGLAVMASMYSRGAVQVARSRADKDAMEAWRIHEENNKSVDRRAFCQTAMTVTNTKPRRKNAVARQA